MDSKKEEGTPSPVTTHRPTSPPAAGPSETERDGSVLHTTNEVNVDLLQDISTKGTPSPSYHTPSSSASSPPKPPASTLPADTDQTSALTPGNLAAHCRQFASHENTQAGETSSFRPALGAFGIDTDLPSSLVDKMTTTFEGMKPRDRYMAEQDGYGALICNDDGGTSRASTTTESVEGQFSFMEVPTPVEDEYDEGGRDEW